MPIRSRLTAFAVVLVAPAAIVQGLINTLIVGTSGVYYPLGVAIGKIYSEKIPNVKTQAHHRARLSAK